MKCHHHFQKEKRLEHHKGGKMYPCIRNGTVNWMYLFSWKTVPALISVFEDHGLSPSSGPEWLVHSQCLGDFPFNEPLIAHICHRCHYPPALAAFIFTHCLVPNLLMQWSFPALTCAVNQGKYVDERFLEKSQLLQEAEETQDFGTKLKTSKSD